MEISKLVASHVAMARTCNKVMIIYLRIGWNVRAAEAKANRISYMEFARSIRAGGH